MEIYVCLESINLIYAGKNVPTNWFVCIRFDARTSFRTTLPIVNRTILWTFNGNPFPRHQINNNLYSLKSITQ